jgi:hypothetical protein
MNDNGFIIGVFLGFLIGVFIFGIYDIGVIKLDRTGWKCTDVITINNDPSNVECVNYVRLDKGVK